MLPLACSNCWYNPLQHDALGLAVGFCVEHKRVLPAADETTCGRLLRKDLPLRLAQDEQRGHARCFASNRVVQLRSRPARGPAERPNGILRGDPVGEVVGDYGLGAKIETLARLRQMPGVRAELARLSLGRAYVSRCARNGGPWTSGLHLVWWTIERLAERPQIGAHDLRVAPSLPLARFVELSEWSVLMFRLLFVSDVACHAGNDPMGRLSALPEEAANDTRAGSTSQLRGWMIRQRRRLAEALSPDRYARLAGQLHRDG